MVRTLLCVVGSSSKNSISEGNTNTGGIRDFSDCDDDDDDEAIMTSVAESLINTCHKRNGALVVMRVLVLSKSWSKFQDGQS